MTEILHLRIEGDNRIVILAVKGEIRTPWRIQIMVQDFRNMLSRFTAPTIQHLFRECNMAVGWIAKLGVLLQTNLTFTYSPSLELDCIIYDDYLSRSLKRKAI